MFVPSAVFLRSVSDPVVVVQDPDSEDNHHNCSTDDQNARGSAEYLDRHLLVVVHIHLCVLANVNAEPRRFYLRPNDGNLNVVQYRAG
jgi:hypothetical protein